MTWDEICRNADGAIFGEHTLKAKDNAREYVRGLIIGLTGIDVECDDCPEDMIEIYCNGMNIEFDKDGRIVKLKYKALLSIRRIKNCSRRIKNGRR